MASEIELAWFSGIFEGEGSFHFVYGKPKGLQISMTDLDILLRIHNLFGGRVNAATRSNQPSHWKNAWIWNLHLRPAVSLAEQMLPYLGQRRTLRAEEFLHDGKLILRARVGDYERKARERLEIVYLHDTGNYTHKEIGELYGYSRSHISHILAGRKDLKPVV